MQSVMRIQANSNLKQNRLDWVTEDLKIADKGEVFYFTGCVSYFDSIFKERKPEPICIPRAAVKIMNKRVLHRSSATTRCVADTT